jgi:hypothetical protein
MASDRTTQTTPERTAYGFKWGESTISRACEHKGHRIVMIETPRQRLMVRITPTGLIRVDTVEANSGELLSVSV